MSKCLIGFKMYHINSMMSRIRNSDEAKSLGAHSKVFALKFALNLVLVKCGSNRMWYHHFLRRMCFQKFHVS